MDLTGNEYMEFVKNDRSLFYYPNDEPKNKFKFIKPKTSFQESTDSYWHYILFDHKLPQQGWKIHLTANIKDAQKLLLTVSQYLNNQQVSYKFIDTVDAMLLSNSKYGDRTESGKFITVYPVNTAEFVQLLPALAEITQDFLEGPYILSDQEWQDSHVFYRYGAFKAMKTVIDGAEVYAIIDNKHNLVEDKRLPYYYQPDFIVEPEQLKNNVQHYDQNEFKKLMNYNVDFSLHYSNAGGVYHAVFKGKEWVLKEGRAFAGLDANGNDGFNRIKHEYKILKQLAEIPTVVDVYESFKAWKHQYLVEEYLQGDTLADFVDSQYPFTANKQKKNEYLTKTVKIITALLKAINQIHQKGIAIGDLQPDNIIILDTDKVKLIDFENAQKASAAYNPGLATPGYSDFNAKTFAEADRIALYKIARYLILPTATGFDWAPELEAVQDKNISNEFGKQIVEFLHNLKKQLNLNFNSDSRHPQYYYQNLTVPSTPFSLNQLNQNIAEVAKGISDNLNYNFKGLIYGDIPQYSSEISYYSVANGAFGAIMALNRSQTLDQKSKQEINIWLEQQLPNLKKLLAEPTTDIGLFTGLSGIATVLYEQGYTKISYSIMKKIQTNVALKLTNDISIYSGLAGVGLAFLCFYGQTKKNIYLQNAIDLGKQVMQIIKHERYTEKTDSGLITGWLGAALFLWKLSIVTKAKQYKQAALRIYQVVIKNSLQLTSDGAFIKDNSYSYERLIPYVNHGSAGLALLMIEFLQDDPKVFTKKELEILLKILKQNDVFVTFFAGLFDGFLSLLILDNAFAICTNNKVTLKKKYNLLNNYLVAQNGGVMVPGRFGFKCSLDLTTGSSGLLLLLTDIKQHTWNAWLPLLRSK